MDPFKSWSPRSDGHGLEVRVNHGNVNGALQRGLDNDPLHLFVAKPPTHLSSATTLHPTRRANQRALHSQLSATSAELSIYIYAAVRGITFGFHDSSSDVQLLRVWSLDFQIQVCIGAHLECFSSL